MPYFRAAGETTTRILFVNRLIALQVERILVMCAFNFYNRVQLATLWEAI